MDVVNERTSTTLTVSFTDASGSPVTPSSVTYQVDDEESGTQVVAPTSISPAQSVQITLPPDAARIITGRPVERRVVTITATYGASDQITTQRRFLVRNLSKVA